MARTESCEACLSESASAVSDSLTLSIPLLEKFIFLFFFPGDQLGPLMSFKISFSSSLSPSKKFFHPRGSESGSER